jgi:hydrogenase nickel incorporation protein HypB
MCRENTYKSAGYASDCSAYASNCSACRSEAHDAARSQCVKSLAVELVGPPGCGKTALIKATLERIHDATVGVIVEPSRKHRDMNRLAGRCDCVAEGGSGQSGGECHPLDDAVSQMKHRALDVVFVENAHCAPDEVVGTFAHSVKVAMFTVTGGDDKAMKYPHFVDRADLVLVNKIDLLPHVQFDVELFSAEVRMDNPDVPILHLSVVKGTGLDAWFHWLEQRRRDILPVEDLETTARSELYVG